VAECQCRGAQSDPAAGCAGPVGKEAPSRREMNIRAVCRLLINYELTYSNTRWQRLRSGRRSVIQSHGAHPQCDDGIRGTCAKSTSAAAREQLEYRTLAPKRSGRCAITHRVPVSVCCSDIRHFGKNYRLNFRHQGALLLTSIPMTHSPSETLVRRRIALRRTARHMNEYSN